jgi:ribonuclease BN (tRNA processing enzyme)
MEVLFPGSSNAEREFDSEFVELPDGVETFIGSVSVTAHGVVHASGAPAYALRIACDGRVIAYSGDTEWTDALVRAAQGADLFICEAYFFQKRMKFHLDYGTLMAHRAQLGCRRLVLTHMSADMLRRLDDVEVECAEDGKSIVL